MRAFRRWLCPDEFTAQEWRHALRWRSMAGALTSVAFGLLALSPLLLVMLRQSGGAGLHDTILILTLIAVSGAPLFVVPAMFSYIWTRPAFESTLGELLTTPVGAFPWVRARLHVLRCLMMGFHVALVAAAVLQAGEILDERDFPQIVLVPLAEALLSAASQFWIVWYLVLRQRTMVGAWTIAVVALAPLHGLAFLMVLTAAKVRIIHSGDQFLVYEAVAAALGLAMWAHVVRRLPGAFAEYVARRYGG